MVSSSHAVCSKGLYIAMISTTVETDNPESEIQPALDLLGNVLEMFVQVHTFYVPTDDGKKDNVTNIAIHKMTLSNIYVYSCL
jgi:Rab GDP dissociation inhibitor